MRSAYNAYKVYRAYNASAFRRYLTSGVQLLHARGVRSIGLLLGTPDTAGVQYCDGANTTARRLGMEVTELIRVARNSAVATECQCSFPASSGSLYVIFYDKLSRSFELDSCSLSHCSLAAAR